MTINDEDSKIHKNKINFINLSSFLKKNDKPMEFKVVSQNSSRSEIKVEKEKHKLSLGKILFIFINKNHLSRKHKK